MKKEFYRIGRILKAPVHVKELHGRFLSTEEVYQWIDNQPIEHTDVVILYYTGHGLRTSSTPTIWPSLFFPKSKEIIDLHTISERLYKRPAALFITLADCCNNYVREKKLYFSTTPELAKHKSMRLAKDSCRQLFTNTRGFIIASGCIPGMRSWCSPQKGSMFTNAFLQSLRYELEEPNPSWSRIMNKARARCLHLQRPQFSLDLR
jgi:hypothetical protein